MTILCCSVLFRAAPLLVYNRIPPIPINPSPNPGLFSISGSVSNAAVPPLNSSGMSTPTQPGASAATGSTYGGYGALKYDVVPPFWKAKYEKEASKYWDQFYRRHQTHFFKDRHWLVKEFSDWRLAQSSPSTSLPSTEEQNNDNNNNQRMIRALEIGCGVGNTIFPLLESENDLYMYAFDFAPTAVELVKKNPLYASTQRCLAAVCDITKQDPALIVPIPLASLDFIFAIFVLSAIDPSHYPVCLERLVKLLKPGGMLLVRDYGIGDAAQERFALDDSHKKLDENFFVRQDGTRSYFFSLEYMEKLVKDAGLEVVENVFIMRQIENKKLNKTMDRCWIQLRARKPL